MNKMADEALRFNHSINVLMTILLVLVCLAGPSLSKAEGLEYLEVGKQYGGLIFACKTLEDANDVSTVHSVDGIDKAGDVFDKKEAEGKCLGAMVPFTPKKVASIAKGRETVYVIEVEVYGKTVYLITTASLNKGRET